jgi:hypothetical protein
VVDQEQQHGSPGSASLIVAFRVLLLVLAAAAVTAAVVIAVRGREQSAAATVRYACPMHPEVRSSQPGECPICRMALERVGFVPGVASKPYLDAAGMADLRAVDNIKKHNIVDFVRRHSLLPPLRELRAPAWVEADGKIAALFYDDQIAALVADERGTFSLTTSPQTVIAVTRTADEPLRWDGSTSRIRFSVVGASRGTRSGQVGWLEVAPRPRPVLGVATGAIVQSPEGPYVLAWSGHDFTFVKRPIEIGETFSGQGFAVVLKGLQVNDRVIARATFFVDADRRLNPNAGEVALGAP